MFILSSSILIFYPDILFLSYLSYVFYLINRSCLSHLSHPSYLSISLIYLTISKTIYGYMHICSWIRSKPPFSKPSIWLGGAMGMSQCKIGTPGGLQSRRGCKAAATRWVYRQEEVRLSEDPGKSEALVQDQPWEYGEWFCKSTMYLYIYVYVYI